MTFTDLRVESRRDPREIDEPHPRFTWRREAGAAVAGCLRLDVHDVQTGERMWAATVAAGERAAIYGGRPLAAAARYRWTVATEDGTGAASAEFGTGIRDRWSARWIGRETTPAFDDDGRPVDTRIPTPIPRSWQVKYTQAPLQLRREFLAPRAVRSATLFATARGVYRAHLNGRRIGRDELTPGWTDYRTLIEYQGYDVTDLVRTGENVLAAEVADGWWSGAVGYNTRSHAQQYGVAPQFLAELHLSFDDGSRVVVGTDEQWRECPGEIVMADLLMGEYRDAVLRTPGWTLPGPRAEHWRPVRVVERDAAVLRGQDADPVRVAGALAAREVRQIPTGVLVDFGQNLAGRVRMRVRDGAVGDVITVTHGEMTVDDRLYTDNLRSAEARDVFVAAGGDETFEPAFTFHGFRYAHIEGLRSLPDPADLCAVVLSSTPERRGRVETSSPLIGRIVENTWWSQLGNFLAVPTDCPQRDERLGWTADAQVFASTAGFNADVEAFLRRWIGEVTRAQSPDGRVPDVVPVPPAAWNFDHGAPGWGDAVVIVPWEHYRLYADRRVLERAFPHMRAWVDLVHALNEGGLWRRGLGNNYGDWLSVGEPTPPSVVAAAYQIRSTDLVSRVAAVLERPDVARAYSLRAQRLRLLFREAFVDDDGRVYGDTQTGYLMAISWGLVPAERRDRAAEHLVAAIEREGVALTTGFLGVSLLGPTLTGIGRSDLVVDLLLREEYPSWGYSIRHGATTIWERWNGWTAHDGFQSADMNSFNHYSLGSISDWVFRHLAGIDQTPESAGFRELRVAPVLDPRLNGVSASFEGPYGMVGLEWRRSGDEVRVRLTVPPGCTAQVVLPGLERTVGEGDREFVVAATGAA